MTTRSVEFPFAYRMVFVPRRGKSERNLILKGSAFVDVPVLDAGLEPVVDVRLGGYVPQPRYDVDGVLYRDEYVPPPGVSMGRTLKLLYPAGPKPWSDYLDEANRPERPSQFDRLVLDEHDRIKADVVARASRLRLRGEGFIYPQEAPSIAFHCHPGTAMFQASVEFNPRDWGYKFPVDRYPDVARTFAETLMANGTAVNLHVGEIRIKGDARRAYVDCRAINAHAATVHVRHYLGERMLSSSPEHIGRIADLVEMGDAVLSDVSLVSRVKGMLEEMAAPYPGASPVRRHANIGLEAIAIAERFHEEHLAASPASLPAP